VVWLFDATEPGARGLPESFRSEVEHVPVLSVANKVDLVERPPAAAQAISVKTGVGLDALVAELARRAADRVGTIEGAAITQARHRQALEETLACLTSAIGEDGSAGVLPELIAEDLRRAAASLGRITGRVDAEMVLDVVFQRFCIGK
jgi:tRNA modification GTPase